MKLLKYSSLVTFMAAQLFFISICFGAPGPVPSSATSSTSKLTPGPPAVIVDSSDNILTQIVHSLIYLSISLITILLTLLKYVLLIMVSTLIILGVMILFCTCFLRAEETNDKEWTVSFQSPPIQRRARPPTPPLTSIV